MVAKKTTSPPSGKAKPKASKATPAKKHRQRIDWEAIERTWRTGKFTQAQLAAKFGIDPATLNRQIKKDRKADSTRWQQDLTEAVRQATNARLMTEMVKSHINEGQSQVNFEVKTAAEINAAVILRHRDRVARATDVAMRMLGELDLTTKSPDELEALFEKITEDTSGPALAAAQQQFREFMRLHSRVGSAQKLMDALGKAQALERQAFGLDDAGKPPPPAERSPLDLTDDELVREILADRAARKGE